MIAAIFSAVFLLMFSTDVLLHAQASRGPGSPIAASAADAGPVKPITLPAAGPAESTTDPPALSAGADGQPLSSDVPALAVEKEPPREAAEGFAGSVVPDYTDEVAAPEGEAVDTAWFSDAVLIGDSRVDGFRLYNGASEGSYIVRAGMSVYEVVREKQNISVGGAKYSAYQL